MYDFFGPCLAQYSRWDFFRKEWGSSNLIKYLLVTYEFCYYHSLSVNGVQLTVLGIIKYRLCMTQYICLLIWPLAHLSRRPSSSVYEAIYADSCHDSSRRYTLYLRTRTASFVHRNVPSRLKYLLEWVWELLFVTLGSTFSWCQTVVLERYVTSTSCCPRGLGITQANISFVPCSYRIFET